MKFIYTADWHFSNYSNDVIIKESGLAERLHYLVVTIMNIINYAREKKIKKIIIGGDILHNKSVIYSFALSVLIDLFKNNSDIEFITLDGNHDMSSRTIEGVSGLKALDSISNVQTIHECEVIENIVFVPWKYVTKEKIREYNTDYLISHFGVNEAVLNSGISIVSDVALKDLSHFKTVLLGHYHKPQFLKNLYYVGSPIHLDRGEKNEDKRFLVVDTDNHTIESVLTEGYKKYYELKIDAENKMSVLSEIAKLKELGHEVRLIKTSDVDTSDLEKDFDVVDKQERDITNRGITANMTMSDKLNRYMEIKEIPEEKREIYRLAALEIIDSCSSKG